MKRAAAMAKNKCLAPPMMPASSPAVENDDDRVLNLSLRPKRFDLFV